MDNNKSKATGKSSSVTKAEQVSAHSKNAASSGRITVQMVQNVLLIWLDQNIDDNSTDYRNTIAQLRRTVNTINTFTDGEQCVHFLENMDNEKACMIISGSFGQDIVPRVHNMSQVDSIFIFCGNKNYDKQWTKDWSKIKGVFTEITRICDALKQAAQQCEQNVISISIMGTDDDVSKKNLDQLDPSFMYTQIMKEILLTIKFEQQHIQEFITYCRNALADNAGQLQHVDKLERKYRDQTPIWWYTYECLLYPMLNRALRLMDTDPIIKLGFFIGDLHRQIEQLHNEQFGGPSCNKSFSLYRGQGMDKEQFEKMTANKGGLLSFNCFLSTSKDRNVSLGFAQCAATNADMVGVLFVMRINPAQSTTPFASVIDVGCYAGKEEEVLFPMQTVFRIGNITPMRENDRLFRVELTLTNDNDKDLRRLTNRIREETFPNEEGWYRLGSVLLKMGHPQKAQRVYEILLEQETDESAKAPIYHQLGFVKYQEGEYPVAIRFYEKALAIQQQSLPPNHPDLAMAYGNIGNVYRNMGDYPKALSSHEKALAIRQQSLPPNHPDLAMSYNNIGIVYKNMSDYPKALSSYEKVLAIDQQSFPPNHPVFAISYNNIGSLYGEMGEYSKALPYFEKAHEIKRQSLPPNHPDLASSYDNIGLVYHNMGDYPKAFWYYEKALAIRQQSLPPNHPDLASSYKSIGAVYQNMGDYPKALSYSEKALEISQKSLPPNHLDLAMAYSNIGNVYANMGDYPKALSSYEKALTIAQQLLPPNHPTLGSSYCCIGNVYHNMGDYPKALSSYDKALAIQQQSLPPNHPNLAGSYNNIGNVCADMVDNPKALSYYERALAIQQQSLTPNHPDLASSYNNIGSVYHNMDDYPKALSYYEKALAIQQQPLPPNHPSLAISHYNIGLLYEKMDSYSKACSSYERAVKIGQKSLPSNHPDLRDYRNKLVNIKKKL
jgi:tetratricopeptide (TPR) repeat protein